jgi:hypothetical protein
VSKPGFSHLAAAGFIVGAQSSSVQSGLAFFSPGEAQVVTDPCEESPEYERISKK